MPRRGWTKYSVELDDAGRAVAAVCTSCGEKKPASEFPRRASRVGIAMPCTVCRRPYRCQAAKLYRKRHPDKVKAALASWLARNPQYERERAKRRWRTDPVYRLRIGQSKAQWSQRNPTYYALKAHERRATARAAGPMVTRQQWAIIVDAYDRCCVYCGARSRLTVDHLIPLARGGTHAPANLVPACKSCNSMKGRRYYAVFLKQVPQERRDAFQATRRLALPRIALEMRLGSWP